MSIPTWDGPSTGLTGTNWTSSGTGPEREQTLQEKLYVERLELSIKIDKLKNFMTMSPDFKVLSWHHRRLLEAQLDNMSKYEGNLIERMILLNQKEEEND